MRILLVDDEPAILDSVGAFLRAEGHEVGSAGSAERALALFADAPWDVVVTDVRMPGAGGIALLKRIKESEPEAEVVVMAGHGTLDDAVEALRAGAADFIRKPIDLGELMLAVEKAARIRSLRTENVALRDGIARRRREDRLYRGFEIVGESAAIGRVRDLIARTAEVPNTTVLVRGETGAGKELVARQIHLRCARSARPFVSVNASAFTETLVETELFGHERGAFTGAVEARKGVVELAHGGVLFLDEIGDLKPEIQGRLLRVLEEGSVRRVGGERSRPVDFRLISATNRDLEAMVETGAFRKDLYYRVRGFVIDVPPLRERIEDAAPLAAHFIRIFAAQMRREVSGIDEEVLRLLTAHPWPGNVRELRSAVENAVIVSKGPTLCAADFAGLASVRAASGAPAADVADVAGGRAASAPVSMNLAAIEREAIDRAITESGGDVKAAARLLGIGYSALRYRLRRRGGKGRTPSSE